VEVVVWGGAGEGVGRRQVAGVDRRREVVAEAASAATAQG